MRVSNESKRMLKRCVITLLEIVLIAAAVYGIATFIDSISFAESNVKAWVICKPGGYVNARAKAETGSDISGRFDAGDEILLDGTTNNGFAHIAYPTFEDDAWVYTGYVVFDKPVWKGGLTAKVSSNAKLAVRSSMTGEVIKWLKNGQELQVFWYTDEWCVTNYGYVMTEWIDMVGDVI